MTSSVVKAPIFTGFSKKLPKFLFELEFNNNRPWFEENRSSYEDLIKNPAKNFLEAIHGPMLSLRENITVDPRRSIFRIYRDARFTKNKAPYKPWVSMFFWEGTAKKTENPWFYLRISPKNLLVGWGYHRFSKPVLDAYRKEITSLHGKDRFKKLIKKLEKKWLILSWKHYKRYPHGYNQDSPNSEYLLYNGLSIMEKYDIPKELYSKKFTKYCVDKYKDYLDLHEWLVILTWKAI